VTEMCLPKRGKSSATGHGSKNPVAQTGNSTGALQLPGAIEFYQSSEPSPKKQGEEGGSTRMTVRKTIKAWTLRLCGSASSAATRISCSASTPMTPT
jgi:hypothetical protein